MHRVVSSTYFHHHYDGVVPRDSATWPAPGAGPRPLAGTGSRPMVTAWSRRTIHRLERARTDQRRGAHQCCSSHDRSCQPSAALAAATVRQLRAVRATTNPHGLGATAAASAARLRAGSSTPTRMLSPMVNPRALITNAALTVARRPDADGDADADAGSARRRARFRGDERRRAEQLRTRRSARADAQT